MSKLSSKILIPPDFFHEPAFFQVVDEAVVVDFFRLLSDGTAAFAGHLDSFGDRFCRDNGQMATTSLSRRAIAISGA